LKRTGASFATPSDNTPFRIGFPERPHLGPTSLAPATRPLHRGPLAGADLRGAPLRPPHFGNPRPGGDVAETLGRRSNLLVNTFFVHRCRAHLQIELSDLFLWHNGTRPRRPECVKCRRNWRAKRSEASMNETGRHCGDETKTSVSSQTASDLPRRDSLKLLTKVDKRRQARGPRKLRVPSELTRRTRTRGCVSRPPKRTYSGGSIILVGPRGSPASGPAGLPEA